MIKWDANTMIDVPYIFLYSLWLFVSTAGRYLVEQRVFCSFEKNLHPKRYDIQFYFIKENSLKY